MADLDLDPSFFYSFKEDLISKNFILHKYFKDSHFFYTLSNHENIFKFDAVATELKDHLAMFILQKIVEYFDFFRGVFKQKPEWRHLLSKH